MRMESFEAKPMPQFSSAEEEVAYLREQLAHKERELGGGATEAVREQLAHETIRAYREMPTESALHPAQRMETAEQEGFVLRLSPEPHDTVMEELLGVLLERGIKNAMNLAESMHNPHVDDDFHRFLVQYLQTAGSLPGLKESSPLYKALKMRLFEVALPETEPGKEKSLKELLSMMEQFYAGMHSVGYGRENYDKSHFTL